MCRAVGSHSALDHKLHLRSALASKHPRPNSNSTHQSFNPSINQSISKKKAEGESEWELEERMRTSRCIFVSGGGRGLTEREAAQEIVSEARRMVGDDLLKMGLRGVLPLGAKTGEREEAEDAAGPPSSKSRFRFWIFSFLCDDDVTLLNK